MRIEHIIQTSIAAICVAVVALMLGGCKAQDCIPETIVRDSIRTEYKLDSIYLYEKDSVFIKEKADTVFVEKWKTRYKDVLKIERDTIWQENTIVEVQEVKYIPQAVKWLAGIGAFFIVFFLVKFGLWVYRKFTLQV